MPLAGAVLISQMIDDIKVEARIKGSDNMNITILAIINEELLTQNETNRYSDLLVEGYPFTAVAGQGKYALPADFLNVKAVYYGRMNEGPDARVLRFKNDFVERSRDGIEPKFYEITGNMLSIFPYGGVLVTDVLSLDYWQQPMALVLSDTFPTPKLYATIKKRVISRIHTFSKDFNAATMFDKNAEQSEKESLTSEDNADTE